MNAEVLREAARLMRERAEDATGGPWSGEAMGSEGHRVYGPTGSRAPMRGRAIVASCGWQDWDESAADAAHIASWHPAVALAVADFLDHDAELIEQTDKARANDPGIRPVPLVRVDRALAVARAYLGDPS